MTNPPQRVALVLVDVVNAFDFDGSEELVSAAKQAALRIERLAASAREAHVPVVYVNDNFGMWQSDFRAVTERCLGERSPGREIVGRLLPRENDYFVLKPRHSGFLATPLQELLEHLGAASLVLAGFATDLCVLFTALDAHARGFWVTVPADATAARDGAAQSNALNLLEHSVGASIVTSAAIDWSVFARERRSLF